MIAAVAVCESSVRLSRNVSRPAVCVSPRDITQNPHLHAFYTSLGFIGGDPVRGGNYELRIDDQAEVQARLRRLLESPPSAPREMEAAADEGREKGVED